MLGREKRSLDADSGAAGWNDLGLLLKQKMVNTDRIEEVWPLTCGPKFAEQLSYPDPNPEVSYCWLEDFTAVAVALSPISSWLLLNTVGFIVWEVTYSISLHRDRCSLCISCKAYWLSISTSVSIRLGTYCKTWSEVLRHLLSFPPFEEILDVFWWVRGAGCLLNEVHLGMFFILALESTTGFKFRSLSWFLYVEYNFLLYVFICWI